MVGFSMSSSAIRLHRERALRQRRERERETERQRDREREQERQTERKRDRHRQSDRQTDRQRPTPRQRNIYILGMANNKVKVLNVRSIIEYNNCFTL